MSPITLPRITVAGGACPQVSHKFYPKVKVIRLTDFGCFDMTNSAHASNYCKNDLLGSIQNRREIAERPRSMRKPISSRLVSVSSIVQTRPPTFTLVSITGRLSVWPTTSGRFGTPATGPWLPRRELLSLEPDARRSAPRIGWLRSRFAHQKHAGSSTGHGVTLHLIWSIPKSGKATHSRQPSKGRVTGSGFNVTATPVASANQK